MEGATLTLSLLDGLYLSCNLSFSLQRRTQVVDRPSVVMTSIDSSPTVPPVTHGPIKDDVDAESIPDDERPVAPDQFDPKYETSKWEIWAYYAYYVGNNGLTLFNFAPTAFQNLLYEAAGDSEVLHFAGRDRTINSIVLVSNGISFAIQIVLFLVIGSYAGDHVATSV